MKKKISSVAREKGHILYTRTMIRMTEDSSLESIHRKNKDFFKIQKLIVIAAHITRYVKESP